MVVRGPHSDGFEVSDATVRRVRALAERFGTTPDDILRLAIDRYERSLGDAPAQDPEPGESVFDILQREGLIGCLEDTPPDLSTNKAYMEGFGEGSGRG